MSKRLRFITAIVLTCTMAFTGSFVFAGTEAPAAEESGVVNADVIPADGDVDEEQADEELPPEIVTEVEEPAISEEPEAVMEDQEALEVTAEESEAAEEELTGVVQAQAGEPAVKEDNGGKKLMKTDANGNLIATTLNYTTSKVADGNAYSFNASTNGTYSYVIVKVNTSGKLFTYAQTAESNTRYTDVIVGKFDPATKDITYTNTRTGYLAPGNYDDGIGGYDVKAGGTYCIGFKSAASGMIFVQPYVYSYATRTLPAAKTMLTSGYVGTSGTNKYGTSLYKIKASKSGYIRVFLKEYGYDSYYGKVTLLNAKKKVVSDKLSFSTKYKYNYVCFGVTKGTTYYLRVNDCAGSYNEQYRYGIMYKIYGATLKANTSKKKATTLKRKANFIKRVQPATGKSMSQWYKFKVTKKRKTAVRIDATYIKSGKTTATIYCGKKKVGVVTIDNGFINTIKITHSNKYGYAKKGTYYVKLSKSAKANGRYKIKYLY